MLIAEEAMKPVSEVRLHIFTVDFGDPSLPAGCVEGWAEIDERYAVIM